MDIKVIGTAPEELSRRFTLSSYVVDGQLAIDAGSLGIGLTLADQRRIRDILLTHTHIDHLATLPLFIENCYGNGNPPVIYATPHNVAMLKKHVFNNILWPDLQSISTDFFVLSDVEPGEEVTAGQFSFHMFPVNHPIPTFGIVLRRLADHREVLFTSDTTICDVIWMEANRCKHLAGIFIEVSFPDSMRELALSSGHLTPSLLRDELRKLRHKVPIFLIHYKNQFLDQIEAEVATIAEFDLHVCNVGETIHLE